MKKFLVIILIIFFFGPAVNACIWEHYVINHSTKECGSYTTPCIKKYTKTVLLNGWEEIELNIKNSEEYKKQLDSYNDICKTKNYEYTDINIPRKEVNDLSSIFIAILIVVIPSLILGTLAYYFLWPKKKK